MTAQLNGGQLLRLGAFLFTAATTCLRGQDPLRILPNNYHLVYENPCVRVIDVVYAAHEKLPVHNHSAKPTVYVYLTDSGPVRFSHIEEHAFTLVRPPERAGTFRLSPGRLEKHEVENLGDIPTEFLRVELKQVPLGFQGGSFRSSKSFDVTHSGVSTEFNGPFVRIRSVIAVGRDTTEVKGADAPALLISFTPASVEVGGSASDPQRLERGDVLWINAHRSYRMNSEDGTIAAHVLQITFLPRS